MKFKSFDELDRISTPELLDYRKKLLDTAHELKNQIKEMNSAWKAVKDVLRLRLVALEHDIHTLEKKRENATSDKDWNELDLH